MQVPCCRTESWQERKAFKRVLARRLLSEGPARVLEDRRGVTSAAWAYVQLVSRASRVADRKKAAETEGKEQSATAEL